MNGVAADGGNAAVGAADGGATGGIVRGGIGGGGGGGGVDAGGTGGAGDMGVPGRETANGSGGADAGGTGGAEAPGASGAEDAATGAETSSGASAPSRPGPAVRGGERRSARRSRHLRRNPRRRWREAVRRAPAAGSIRSTRIASARPRALPGAPSSTLHPASMHWSATGSSGSSVTSSSPPKRASASLTARSGDGPAAEARTRLTTTSILPAGRSPSSNWETSWSRRRTPTGSAAPTMTTTSAERTRDAARASRPGSRV